MTKIPIDHDLYTLSKEINEINKANGWNVIQPNEWEDEDYKVPAVLALITSEVSEALEGYRKDDFENFKEELADIIIRVLDLSGGLDIDIDEEVQKKLEKNRNRSHKHGGKRI